MAGHFQELTPVFIVDDVVPTRGFFRDRLGFHVIAEVEHRGAPGFCMLQRDSVMVMIQSDASVRDDAGESYVPGPYKASVYITVDNVEAMVPTVADADVVLPLRRTPYGMHEIGVREPGGNLIVFASRLE
ncbi:MAG: VOC family protein [Candidatus Velthaea sp.]